MKDKETKANPGDTVTVIKTDGGKVKGRLIESYDKDVLLVKLESGYNIGIKKDDIKGISIEKRENQESKKEEIKQNTKLPSVSVIMTGGTIASKLDYNTGGVKWLMNPDEIFSIAPKVFDVTRIKAIEKPFMLASENMTPKEWKILATKTAELLNKPENMGVIITHGTDTLHYTAAALSFMLKNVNKPVVLTYAQRSADRGSSDTALNLACAGRAALSDIAEVMLVGHATTNDDYCIAIRGTKARKMHTSRRDTFRPINDLPIAKIYTDRIEALQDYKKRNDNLKVKADTKFEEKIALVKSYPGAKPDILEFYAEKGYKGIIIEATGLGHVATEESRNNWLPAIKECIRKGIIICFTPQTIYGRLDPYVYSPGRKLAEAGVIFLEDMLSETAYVKLGWVLGHTSYPAKVKEMMLENYAGETNKRIDEESFLY
nr:glutamyl-tRNA(Gln) amidotransferase subunit D [uncultured archaeon]